MTLQRKPKAPLPALSELRLERVPAYDPAARNFNYARKLWDWFTAPPPTDTPAQFALKEIRFNYSRELRGPCDFKGRNYLIRPVNDTGDRAVRKQTKVFARGTGKTLCDEVKICFKLKFAPGTRGLSVWPAIQGEGGSEDFAGTRLAKTIKASRALSDLIPATGQERMLLNKKKINLNGSHYGFIGSNSGGKGVGNRLTDIFFDEVEKYPPTLKQEGSILNLVEGSVEGVSDYQIHYSSTPTIETGLIWALLQKSNLHLYFVPCPHCNPTGESRKQKAESRNGDSGSDISTFNFQLSTLDLRGWFIYAWSENFAVGLPQKFPDGTPIPMAFVKWDAAAKSKHTGDWDMQKVRETAHVECPHCQAKIFDDPATGHKEWMDTHGQWVCVKPGEPNHVGYQLSALYAPRLNVESSWGGRAIQFLTACAEGGTAVLDFVNRVLALVYVSQESGSNRIELSARPMSQPDWIPILTADFHKNHPYIWFVVRKWCAFKLLAPPGLTDGRPDFAAELDAPENHPLRDLCAQLIGVDSSLVTRHSSPVWNIIGEISRLNSADPATGRSPLLDFLLAQKITGKKLAKFFHETAHGDTLEFRRLILLEMFTHAGGDPKHFRAARGGDSELIAAGYCDRSGEAVWDEFRDLVTEFKIGHGLKIPARAVAIDCGYAEKFDRAVLRHVHESATAFDYYNPTIKTKEPGFTDLKLPYFQVHGWNGWQAIRGKPTFQPQGYGNGRDLGRHVEDPFFGTPDGGTAVVDILEIPTALFWLRKDDLRQKRTKQIYGISPAVSFFPKHYLPDGARTEASRYRKEDYDKQSNMMIFDEQKRVIRPRYGVGGAQSKRHPDHPDDCETYQVALATHLEFFDEKTK